jgi:polysaccharide export outer membrane protein
LKTSAALLSSLALAGLALLPPPASAQARSTGAAPAPRQPASAPATTTTPRQPTTTTTTPAPSPTARPAARAVPPGAWMESEYRLGPGDKLRVEVFEQPQISQSLQIRPDGKITIPHVGEIAAAGQTSLELRDALTASLKEYVLNPVVTVIVQEATSAQVCIIGEVRAPGCQVMTGPTTVLQALSRANGVTEFANRSAIRILRNSGTRLEKISFNYKDAVAGDAPQVYLQPGDQVVVP